MKNTLPYFPLLAVLALLVSGCGAQNRNYMLRVPFDHGFAYDDENLRVRFDSLVLFPTFLQLHKEPDYTDSNGGDSVTVIYLELQAAVGGVEVPNVTLMRSVPDIERWQIDFPVAVGGCLVGMEVTGDKTKPQVALTVERNTPGREFFLNVGQSAVVDGLTVRFDENRHEHMSFEPDGPFIGGAVFYLTLSDGNAAERVSFTSYPFIDRDYFHDIEFGVYRVRILDCFNGLKMKIEKDPPDKIVVLTPIDETTFGDLTVRFDDVVFHDNGGEPYNDYRLTLSESGNESEFWFSSRDMDTDRLYRLDRGRYTVWISELDIGSGTLKLTIERNEQ